MWSEEQRLHELLEMSQSKPGFEETTWISPMSERVAGEGPALDATSLLPGWSRPCAPWEFDPYSTEIEDDTNAERALEVEETKKFARSDMDLPDFLLGPRGVR